MFLVIVSALITIIIIWWRNNHNKNDNAGKNITGLKQIYQIFELKFNVSFSVSG